MKNVWILIAVFALLATLGWIERRQHRRRLDRIRIRIHVNGTRGKSSVTRLIAAGLRGAGIVTCAKTTGALARLILPDGQEQPIVRGCRPNVLEQIGVVRAAARWGAEALVVECMALTPSLQWLCQWQLIRATHAVITNAREDHLDVMGPTRRDVAWALAGTIPPQGVVFTADSGHDDIFRYAADDRNSRLVIVSPADVAAVTAADLAGFAYAEHAENVALALAVCAQLGIDRATALRGMWLAAPDPGALAEWHWQAGEKEIWLVNGFAANDPQSSEEIWQWSLARFPRVERRIALFNCRSDRPERSWRLGQACAAWQPADHYVLVGGGVHHFARAAGEAGLGMRRVVIPQGRGAEDVLATLLDLTDGATLVVGLGNIGGLGLEVVRLLDSRGARCGNGRSSAVATARARGSESDSWNC
ncbi:MAG TPA: poly-gamma-glutamate synthase PgsB [Pirellulales bacterium]|jgi:poly-gamma-glutamate synthase PgsB/CapB|nr:poly-gamma-glutamate synthase PgsB [Pirellulales bacterium]